MIGETFADNCKLLGTTPNDFSLFTGVPKKTLGTWFHTKPLLLQRLFESYEVQQLRCKLSEFNNVERSLRDTEGYLEYYKARLKELESPRQAY